jgi:hypothetical protein
MTDVAPAAAPEPAAPTETEIARFEAWLSAKVAAFRAAPAEILTAIEADIAADVAAVEGEAKKLVGEI